jgi:hypothetical protein
MQASASGWQPLYGQGLVMAASLCRAAPDPSHPEAALAGGKRCF